MNNTAWVPMGEGATVRELRILVGDVKNADLRGAEIRTALAIARSGRPTAL